jgi:hypothetical protein
MNRVNLDGISVGLITIGQLVFDVHYDGIVDIGSKSRIIETVTLDELEEIIEQARKFNPSQGKGQP